MCVTALMWPICPLGGSSATHPVLKMRRLIVSRCRITMYDSDAANSLAYSSLLVVPLP